jgi:hypothetical protein
MLIRFVVVGEPAVMKTRLCYAISTNKPFSEDDYVPTVFNDYTMAFESV